MNNLPNNNKLVLAKLKNVWNDTWYEVLYYVKNEYTEGWHTYLTTSTTFEGSYGHEDKVIAWEYIDDIKLSMIVN